MKSFLIADDSEAKLMMLQMMVEKSGITKNILIAHTTEEAKELIDEHADIAAAFIDYEMPSEEGPAVIRYLHEKNPKARIALVTSANSEKYKHDGEEAGACAFVCTSLSDDIVKETLQHILIEWKEEIS